MAPTNPKLPDPYHHYHHHHRRPTSPDLHLSSAVWKSGDAPSGEGVAPPPPRLPLHAKRDFETPRHAVRRRVDLPEAGAL
ncbi:uncharacterized protein BDZ99DRAFT_461304 [Mytilinidion resinicola]|uniref:Uncharacterized protein n=1 Tax=Mytilinidion resinicola TaxID=574789 RepID=A0A6A6YV57_9PEZI|nr:uncharacterized protein BDZ99DRAFT_461304 [Mytilinidion resinicola]KAF2812650.1 hypothetical protein BDZ99DRAFT_461304 [Mytilinidion resinicola]